MRRLLLGFAMLVAWLGFAQEVGAQGFQVQGNRILLSGKWQVTFVEYDEEFTLVVQTPAGEQRIQLDDDDLPPLPPQTLGVDGAWSIDVISSLGIEEDDCLNPATPCQPAYVEATKLSDDAYVVAIEDPDGPPPVPYDDVILRFDRVGSPVPPVGGCVRETTPVGYYYACAGRPVTQTSFGLGAFAIVSGDLAVWNVTEGAPPSSSSAWYANNITTGTTMTVRQITQTTHDLTGPGIQGFHVVGEIAVWRVQMPLHFVWMANNVRTGTTQTIREITQQVSSGDQFFGALTVSGSHAMWTYGTGQATPFFRWAVFANDIATGNTNTIRQVSHMGGETTPNGLFVAALGLTTYLSGKNVVWEVITNARNRGWFVGCLDTGTRATAVPLTDLVGVFGRWEFIDGFRLVGNRAFWTYRRGGAVQPMSVTLPCGANPRTVDGTLDAAGGTATDSALGSKAALRAPSGVLPPAAFVALDVLPGMEVPPPAGFRSDARTAYIDVELQPALSSPLPAPGVTLTLPLRTTLPPGQALALFEADPTTGLLVPKTGAGGQQIVGTVDPDGTTATFTGVVSFSVLVGLAAGSQPPLPAGSVTYDFIGTPFDFCGFQCADNAPPNWQQNHIVASLTFDAPLPANLPSTLILSTPGAPKLVAWTMRDALGFFSFSSAGGDQLTGIVDDGETIAPLMISTNAAGEIQDYLMVTEVRGTQAGLTGPPIQCDECGSGIASIAAINIGSEPDEWDAISSTTGVWTVRTGAPPPPSTYQISGRVVDANGTPVSGVGVSLSGPGATSVTTGADGTYLFPDLTPGAKYGVVPSKAGFTFAPATHAFANLALSQSGPAGNFAVATGTFARYFAEGASNAFFDTTFALLNPTGAPAKVTLDFQRSDGVVIRTETELAPHTRRTINPKALKGMEDTAFATVITSNMPVVADRTMQWNDRHYGSHAETSIDAPATIWYLAEGATHSGFDLFYLLQNATDTIAKVEVTYLRPAPASPLIKNYDVLPHSRLNIWVDHEGDEFSATDVSAIVEVTNGVPIIVERAMYLDRPGEPFGAGHASAAVKSLAPEWFLAEGATGELFDEFILIANPNADDVTVDVLYLLPDGTTVTREDTVGALSRRTIFVDLDPALADTSLSAIVRARDGAGIIVERTMWFPGPSSNWAEAHNSPGTTASGRKWALADGESGNGTPTETYILIANTAKEDARAMITLYFEDGTQPVEATVALVANSRTTVGVATDPMFGLTFTGLPPGASKRFSAVIESIDGPGALVVERAMYTTVDGVSWAAGTNALGTKLQ